MNRNEASSRESGSSAPRTPPGREASSSGRNPHTLLYMQHPDGDPDELIGTTTYFLHPPSKLSSSASWRSYRDGTLLPLIQERPDDLNLPNFLRQVELVLAWRAAVPPANRFWKADPEAE